MKEKLQQFFYGRRGMDEFSKFLFWGGIAGTVLSVVTLGFLNNVLSGIFSWLGLFGIILAFVRAFSKRIEQREMENAAFFAWRAKLKARFNAFKERRRQGKDYKFFKCPCCKVMLRVPRGKGRIHITCKCGYTLYRKT